MEPVTQPDARLRALLGTDPPAGIAALAAPERAQLAEFIEAARGRQRHGLQSSFAVAMRHVPFPLRPVVRRVLGA